MNHSKQLSGSDLISKSSQAKPTIYHKTHDCPATKSQSLVRHRVKCLAEVEVGNINSIALVNCTAEVQFSRVNKKLVKQDFQLFNETMHAVIW